MTKEELFAIMKGTIIVSCQATPGEPLYDKERSVMPLMARAAKQAGAKMIRTSSVRDIVGIKEETGLPVIGLIKREYPGYTGRITMTMREVDECVEAMADIVSIDCTDCTRGDGLTPAEFLKKVKDKYPNIIIMADCATYEEATAAFANGFTHTTHLFNAMPAFTHRAPGVVGAASDFAEHIEMICDGIHLNPSVVRAVFNMFGPDRVCIISDAMQACGMPNGEYSLGGQKVFMTDGLATLADGTLAGSVTDLMSCMKTAVSFGIPLADAVRAAAVNPAQVLGIFDRCGSLEAGKNANAVVLDADLNVKAVFFRGCQVQ